MDCFDKNFKIEKSTFERIDRNWYKYNYGDIEIAKDLTVQYQDIDAVKFSKERLIQVYQKRF